MKYILFIFLFFIYNVGICQVDNYDLLTKGIDSSHIKTITKYHESKKFPDGKKEFKLQFNEKGKLISIEEYEYPIGPTNPVAMQQEIKYNNEGRKTATYMKAPDGSVAVDTFIYNNKFELIKKQRIADGQVVKSWEYSDSDKKDERKKKFDNKGNLIRVEESNKEFTTYKYDVNGKLIEEIQFQEGKENEKNTFGYDKKNRLNLIKTYLMYVGDGKSEPLTYYFEYEEFR